MLILDTSHERSLIAIFDEKRLLFFDEMPFGLQSSQHLLPRLYQGLKSCNLEPKEVKNIVVAAGPGSYTGIRVGAAVAKTLSYSLGLPLAGVNSLAGFIPYQDGRFAAAIDAKIGGVYLLLGEKKGESIAYLSEPMLCPAEQLEEVLGSIEQVVTPNKKPLLSKLGQAKFIERVPCPRQIARLGAEKIKSGEASDEGELEILYLRKTQAEIERQANH